MNTGIAKKRRSASARAAGTRLHQNLKSFIPSIGQKLLTGSSSGIEAFSSLAKFGEGTGDLKKLEDFSFYNHVWTLLDERLKYPVILAERRIQGIVNVSLIVTADGSMDWKNLRLEGGNKYLRLYVLRVLREAFLKNLELHRFPKLKTPHQLDFIFEFQISERPIQEAKVGRSFTMGQLMTFSRSAQRSHMEWELGPLRGLFPIPAVSLDVLGYTDHLINGDPLLRFLKGE